MTIEGRDGLVNLNLLNILVPSGWKVHVECGILWNEKKMIFCYNSREVSADQRDVWKQSVYLRWQGLLGNIWKLHIQLHTRQIMYEVVYWGIPQFQHISLQKKKEALLVQI